MTDDAQPGKGFKAKWAELSFEKKMTIFAGPLLVVLVSAVLAIAVPELLASDGDQGNDHPETFAKEKLEVLDFYVDAGQRQELLTDPPTTHPRIDVTVRNVGQSVSVITRAKFEVLDFGKLDICEAGGGPLPPSRNYDVLLPLAPRPGESLVVKVSQALEPNTADRFTFSLTTPPEGQQDGVFIYRLAVRLFHDGSAEPTPAGTAVVAAPYLPFPQYFPAGASLGEPSDLESFAPNDGTVQGCYLANEQTYLRMIDLEGSRDPRMSATVAEWQ